MASRSSNSEYPTRLNAHKHSGKQARARRAELHKACGITTSRVLAETVIRSSHHTLIGGSWAVRQLTLEFGRQMPRAKSEIVCVGQMIFQFHQNLSHISIRPNRSKSRTGQVVGRKNPAPRRCQASPASQLQRCRPLPEDSSRDLHAERHTVHSAAAGSITGTCSRSTSSFRHPSISTTAGELRPPPGQHTSRAVLAGGCIRHRNHPARPHRHNQGGYVRKGGGQPP